MVALRAREHLNDLAHEHASGGCPGLRVASGSALGVLRPRRRLRALRRDHRHGRETLGLLYNGGAQPLEQDRLRLRYPALAAWPGKNTRGWEIVPGWSEGKGRGSKQVVSKL